MHVVMKIPLAAALVATSIGSVVGYSHYNLAPHIAPVAARAAGPSAPMQTPNDDALKVDKSWERWRSLTDF
jgi:hypothetical protein